MKGLATARVLPELIAGCLRDLPWPKSMRWGYEKTRFVRPVHWIVALYGGKNLKMEFAGVRSGNKTFGHRFHGQGAIRVRDVVDYRDKLRDARVIVDYNERRTAIADQLARARVEAGGELKEDAELLDHVTGLVEWPVVYLGTVPERFMGLPEAVLVTPMREHQKYFCFVGADGRLLPRFAAVGGVDATDAKIVTAGYERVLNARLADAKFFYDEDLKTPLPTLAEKLDQVVYHRKLGSYKDKVLRDQNLCRWLGGHLHVDQKTADTALRGLWLAKADLLTQMVGEFPELQGVMGRDYAARQGEPPEVANAIIEHYLPKSAADTLPATDAGALCAVADKMDAIVACSAAGLAPTGAGDPYSLRRQALGIIQILLDRGWRVDLPAFAAAAAEACSDRTKTDPAVVSTQVLTFFHARLANWLKQQGSPSDIVDAVLAVRFVDVVDVVDRVSAVEAFARTPEYEAFAAAFKRVANIVGDHGPGDILENLLSENTETALYGAQNRIRDEVDALVRDGDYRSALDRIAAIRPDVDAFFDQTLVMHDDPKIRENRLNLLAQTAGLFSGIADFRRV
ncbi:MAG: glycine--tRNA ligase subunit beta [Deltaproteobacteria bacterium]|nr:glycine--tRNA ligase subunit beta [Deltaproteobacteria bacterium]